MEQSRVIPKTVLDPTALTVAEVYAESAMQVCESVDEAQDLLSELQKLLEVLGEYPDFLSLMTSSLLSPKAKYAVISHVVDHNVSPHTDGLVTVLAKHDRLELLPAVARGFRRLLNERKGILDATVTTATELDAAQRDEIAAAISKATGKEIELRTRVDESVLGGMVMRIGDRVIDASIRRQIERLSRQMLKRRMQQA